MKTLGEIKKGEKEKRFSPIESAGEDRRIVEGYAIVYDSPTIITVIDGMEFYEVIERGALDGADLSDVPFKYNHSNDVMIMARTRNKSLELMPDEKGLFIRAELADTSQGRDLYKLIQRGDIDKMSFAFTVRAQRYDRETRTRIIEKFDKLFDVSAVDIPAYDTTSLYAANSFFEMEILKERKALEKVELRKKLLIKTRYF